MLIYVAKIWGGWNTNQFLLKNLILVGFKVDNIFVILARNCWLVITHFYNLSDIFAHLRVFVLILINQFIVGQFTWQSHFASRGHRKQLYQAKVKEFQKKISTLRSTAVKEPDDSVEYSGILELIFSERGASWLVDLVSTDWFNVTISFWRVTLVGRELCVRSVCWSGFLFISKWFRWTIYENWKSYRRCC